MLFGGGVSWVMEGATLKAPTHSLWNLSTLGTPVLGSILHCLKVNFSTTERGSFANNQ